MNKNPQVPQGWSNAGIYRHDESLPARNCASWTSIEKASLVTRWKEGQTVEQLAKRHMRTEWAICCQLQSSGYDYTKPYPLSVHTPKYKTPTSEVIEFIPCPRAVLYTHNCKNPLFFKENNMASQNNFSLTANQMMVLLSIYRGTLYNEMRFGTFDADLRQLHSKGLVTWDLNERRDTRDYRVTSAGKTWVLSALNRQLSQQTMAEVAVTLDASSVLKMFDTPRDDGELLIQRTESGVYSLADQAFYMVAGGELQSKDSSKRLLHGSQYVHASGESALEEAMRLAKKEQGKKFFVLRTVSVHQVETPISSKNL